MLSIIMPYYNEGPEFIEETLRSIRDSIDVDYEVIIVDDFSQEPLKTEGAKVLRHPANLGVGAAFDTGVKEAASEYLFLMGCDVRFIANGWASKMIREIKNNPEALICSSTVHLDQGNDVVTFEMSRQSFVYNGATILMAYGNGDGQRDILHAQWLPRFSRMVRPEFDVVKNVLGRYGVVPSETDCYEIPCILGAAYGVSKAWYNYIDGFALHRKWGTLEPYISLKSWMFGGSCLTAPQIETAHLFKSAGKKDSACLAYNSMLITWLLFPSRDKDRLTDWLNHPGKSAALEMIEENISEIYSRRMLYRQKIKTPLGELCKRFNLNY